MELCNNTKQLYGRVQSLQSLEMKTTLQTAVFSDDSDDNIISMRMTERTKVLSNSPSHSKYCRITDRAASAGQHLLVKQKHRMNHLQRQVEKNNFFRLLETSESPQTEHQNTLEINQFLKITKSTSGFFFYIFLLDLIRYKSNTFSTTHSHKFS